MSRESCSWCSKPVTAYTVVTGSGPRSVWFDADPRPAGEVPAELRYVQSTQPGWLIRPAGAAVAAIFGGAVQSGEVFTRHKCASGGTLPDDALPFIKDGPPAVPPGIQLGRRGRRGERTA